MSQTEVDFDLVVVGGGMVGPALAALLGQAGLRVGLLERERPARWRPDDDAALRVSALTLATRNVLRAAGVWHGVTSRRLAAFRRMQVWDASGSGCIVFDSADLGEPQLGWIVENPVVQASLYDRLSALDTVEVMSGSSLEGFEPRPEDMRLRLEDGRRVSCRLLVGADGGNSKVRRDAGIDTRGWSYDQRAVVATVATELSHEDTAWQRFLPHGPVAFLPLYDGRSSIVWSTTSEEADLLLELDSELFAEELSEALDWRLGKVELVSERAAYPLQLQHAVRYVDQRLALVGDAAHTVHPLAGQGVNLGILDAAALAEVVLATNARGLDLGAHGALRRYERWRKGHNLLMLGALDGLKRLFGARLAPVTLVRNLGLRATNSLGPVKHLLARHAMGLAGDLPVCARSDSGGAE